MQMAEPAQEPQTQPEPAAPAEGGEASPATEGASQSV